MAKGGSKGSFKQSNKKHKSGKHRTKGEVAKHAGGRLKVVKLPCTKSAKFSKQERLNVTNQRRLQSKDKVSDNALGGKGAPIFCAVVSLSPTVSLALVEALLKQAFVDAVVTRSATGLVHICAPKLRRRWEFLFVDYDNHLAGVLDACKVADCVAFVCPRSFGDVTQHAALVLSCLYAQGIGQTVYLAQGIWSRKEAREMTRLMCARYPVEDVLPMNSVDDAGRLLRNLTSVRPMKLPYVQERPHFVMESFRVDTECFMGGSEDGGTEEEEAVLVVRGYLRGRRALSINSRLHVTGWGDCRLARIELPHADPHPLLTTAGDSVMGSRSLAEAGEDACELLAVADVAAAGEADDDGSNTTDDDASSLALTHDDASDMSDDNMSQGSEKDEMASNDDSASDDDGNDDDVDDSKAVAAARGTTAAVKLADLAASDAQFPDEVDTPALDGPDGGLAARHRFAKYRGLASVRTSPWDAEEGLPAEYDCLARFVNYRHARNRMMKATQTSSSDKPGRTVPPGTYVQLTLAHLPTGLTDHLLTTEEEGKTAAGTAGGGGGDFELTSGDRGCASAPGGLPLLVSALLSHEHRMSVMHLAMMRTGAARAAAVSAGSERSRKDSERSSVVGGGGGGSERGSLTSTAADTGAGSQGLIYRSRDPAVLQVGFRRFGAAPVLTAPALPGGRRATASRYLHPAATDFALSAYAPIMYAPAPALMFVGADAMTGAARAGISPATLCAEDGDCGTSLQFVASGGLNSCDPGRLLLKRVVLSGHPFRISGRHVTVRYMFFSPADVAYFRPVRLSTKRGRTGHITETLGTHGRMKCVFDAPLNSQDTVLMRLYRRVFPRWHDDVKTEAIVGDNDVTKMTTPAALAKSTVAKNVMFAC